LRSLAARGRAIAPVLLLLVVALAAVKEDPEDWANSPQAYFLTAEERAEWKKLDSRDSRADFQERYWLKRDPSPGSEKNEFREMVLARIKTADARFGIEKTPGSRTARGLVFIVLGTPARVMDQRAGPNPADQPGGRRLGQGFTPVAVNEGNETTSTWYYETDRTPKILEAIGRPSLTIRIVVEPSRHSDSIQNPGLFNEIREVVARKSIVNPDLIPPRVSRENTTAPAPGRALAPAVRKLLESPPATARAEGSYVGNAVLFPESGDAQAVFWIYSSKGSAPALFHVLVRSEKGDEVLASSEPAQTASFFSMQTPGLVAMRRVDLPPGSYSASVAVTDAAGGVLRVAELPVQVPAMEKDFAVSSLLITRGPATASKGSEQLFTFSGSFLPPRADAAFSRSESLWYFMEVANPSNPSAITLEPQLRRGTEVFAALPPFPVKLAPIGNRRFLAGVELPLSSIEPGDYVLYVRVRDGESDSAASVLRRADFRVVR
jgi:GWxTD domain-containing protein